MKTFLISTFALCLASAVPTALWAADEHHEPGGAHAAQPAQHAPAASHASAAPRGQSAGHSAQPSHRAATVGPAMGTHDHVTTQQRGTTHAATVQPTNTSQHRRMTVGANTQDNNRAMTKTRSHVDVASFHKNVTAGNRYHFGNYNAPQGYAYHRYSYGESLPQGYFAASYWITNYLNFGLIAPPDGYTWVRYGPDAVLVDEDTGEIVQVVYDQFY
jgi:Ni/Co efflux regulator RcnB